MERNRVGGTYGTSQCAACSARFPRLIYFGRQTYRKGLERLAGYMVVMNIKSSLHQLTGSNLSKPFQIHNIQRTNVVPPPLQVVAPVALIPKPEAVHFAATITEWHVAVWGTAKVIIH